MATARRDTLWSLASELNPLLELQARLRKQICNSIYFYLFIFNFIFLGMVEGQSSLPIKTHEGGRILLRFLDAIRIS